MYKRQPVEMGGSLGRQSATGRGVSYVLSSVSEDLKLDPSKTRVAIQGFGNVGFWAAKLIEEMGYIVTAVSGVDGGAYNSKGIDVKSLGEHQENTGGISGFTGGEPISNQELLELECDVLIPAAIDNVITEDNASLVQASLILEAANHPITPEADQLLNERKVLILPDILVNAGGVIVSYFEWTQNLQEFRWEEERVNQELKKTILRSYQEVRDRTGGGLITPRSASFEIGVERVAHVVQLRGFV